MARRPALPALCAVLVLVIGQLIAFAHQAATRHIECAEHGEELETPSLAEALHACNDQHLVGLDADSGGEHHDDCLVLRAMHESTALGDGWLPPAVALVETTPVTLTPRAVALAHALYRLAPKTSPPPLA